MSSCKTDESAETITTINTISGIEKLSEKQYLFAATLGELYSQLHHHHKSIRYFEKAIVLTNSPVEKNLLKKKLNVVLNVGKQ